MPNNFFFFVGESRFLHIPPTVVVLWFWPLINVGETLCWADAQQFFSFFVGESTFLHIPPTAVVLWFWPLINVGETLYWVDDQQFFYFFVGESRFLHIPLTVVVLWFWPLINVGWGTGSCTDRRKVPGCVFWDFWTAGFVRLVPCRKGLLPCLSLACFGFGSFGLLGPLPLSLPFWPPWPSCLGLAGAFVFWPLRLSWLFALLAWAVRPGMALRWPSSLHFGLCVGLGFLPFCLGLCGLAWPSGGLLFVLPHWGSVAFCLGVPRCLWGVWLMVGPVVTSRDALLFNWNLTETLPIGRHFDHSSKQNKKDKKET